MTDSDDGVSEVLGMILMVSISIIAIGAVMLLGVPMIESGKNRAKMDVAGNSFLTLQNDIEEVVRGPIWVINPYEVTDARGLGPSRETDFELMGGTITVLPNTTNISCMPCNASVGIFNITLPPSNITYQADFETIVYENGAVIRKYEAGDPIMISYPLISIYSTGDNNITISIHAVSLNGTLSSAGGDGKAWVETRLNYYNQTVEPSGFPNSNKTKITIYSRYPDAWKTFFEEKLKGASLVASKDYNISPNPGKLEVQIYGKASNNITKDIFLSVYESRLDVRVR